MSVVTPTVLSAGNEIAATFQTVSIDIRREVNRIPRAELVLADGDAAEQVFKSSDAPQFEPGKEIEIKLRYEGEKAAKDVTVFKGLVVRHAVEANPDGTALVVEAKDAAVVLTGPRKSAVFHDKADSDVVGTLITEAAKNAASLKKGTVAKTKTKHPELVQYHVSDWDFIVSRAEANGLLVTVVDGEVSLTEIKVSGGAKHTFEWGVSQIFDFEMEADAGRQFGALEGVAWDLKKQEPTAAKKAKAFKTSQGDLDAAKIAKALGLATDTLSHPVPIAADELQAWADAALARQRMALLCGRLSTPGIGDISLLDVIEVAGVGKRFNGTTLVTGLRHRVDAGGWQTDVAFGLPSESWAERAEHIADAPAAGLLPAVSGLQIGVVAPFEEDPDKELRVKVFLQAVDAKEKAVWARLASLDAGKERGTVFRPEAEDEVVVGFFNDDPRHPVILGSLYGSKNTPPADLAKPDADNALRVIVSRSGSRLAFIDNDKAQVVIGTPEMNTIVFDDDGQMIELADQHGNTLTMSKDGVVIKSAKDVVIEASGNVEIKGAKVDVK